MGYRNAAKAPTARERLAGATSLGPNDANALRADVARVKARNRWLAWEARNVVGGSCPANKPWKRDGLDCPRRFLSSSQRVPREKREAPPDALDGASVKGDSEPR